MSFLVVGESVAGVAAALEFASQGHSAHLIIAHDNMGLEDSFRIGPTPLNATPLQGTAFADLAFERLRQAQVKTRLDDEWFGGWNRTSIDPVTGELVLDEDAYKEQHRFQSAVFASAGVERGLPREIEAPFAWRGLSYSAWSDAFYFRSKPVVVVGCGYRAFEQALIAAECAASVTLLCEAPDLPPLGLLAPEVARTPHLTVRPRTRVLALQPDAGGTLAHVRVNENGQERLVDAAGVFVAYDPMVTWDIWGGTDAAAVLRARGKLTVAGIAAGIPYPDHAAQFESGVRAARRCLADNT